MRAAAIVLVLLTGCGDDDGPSGLPAADLGGEVSLAVDGAGRTMRLARRGEMLLVLPADAL